MPTRERGRPLAGARDEVVRAADLIDDYAEEGTRISGEIAPRPLRREVRR